MTRLTNPERVEKEARLQEAIAAVERGEKTPYRAVIDFNVQKQTLYNRLNRKLPRNKAHEQEQILTNAEEKELVRWITRLTFTGYPPRPVTLREMVEEIRKRRVRESTPTIMRNNESNPIGQQWLYRFLRRHPELANVKPRGIDSVRVKDTSPERLAKWFKDLETVIGEYKIVPE